MSCHTCSRAQTPRLRFFCPTCARNQIYQLRIEHATVLLEKESIGRQIETAVNSNTNTGSVLAESVKEFTGAENGCFSFGALQTIANEQTRSSARLKSLKSEIESIGSMIKNRQFDISQRKLALARRRSDSESAKYQLGDREASSLASIQNNIKRTDHLWHTLHSKTAEARIFLCREAAGLYGLRKRIKKKESGLKETYTIGGVNIVDLRDMNGVSSDHISTLFSYIAHLLVLVSHYLSLRLPAEITLPHRNYPNATIYAPSASYFSRDEYLASSPYSSLPPSPTTSRTADSRSHLPRPRPLSVDKPLPKLAREDPGTYGLFLEGATLLAWNISWLGRSQGLNLASDSWEDICDIGKNLWQLLVAPPAQPSTLARALAGRDTRIKASKDSPKTTIQRTKSFPMLGHYSHGTTHSFLCASEGTEFIRSWKLPTATKVADKLKATLLGEMASAEWELLEETEWDDAATQEEPSQPQDLSNTPGLPRDERPVKSETESLPTKQETHDAPTGPPRVRGTSGWTKLRNR